MTRIHRRARRRLGFAIGMLIILTGCPLPLPPGYERASRQNVGEQVPEFIICGRTTREDVLLTLGEPDGAASDANWLAWGSARGEGGVVFVFPAGSGGAALGTMVTEYRRVIVTFDERGVVSEAKYDTKTCPLLFGGINQRGGWEDPCLDITRPEKADGSSMERATPMETRGAEHALPDAPVQAFVDDSLAAREVAVIETAPDLASLKDQRGTRHYIQGIDGQDAGEMTRRVRVAAGERSITVRRYTAGADLPPTLMGSERGCATIRASVVEGGTYMIGGASIGAVVMTDAQTKNIVAVAEIEPGTFANSHCPPE